MIAHTPPAYVVVHKGDTLSGIAAHYDLPLSVVEHDNPQLSGNYNLIYAGEKIYLTAAHAGAVQAPAYSGPAVLPVQPAQTPAQPVQPQVQQAPAAQPVSNSGGGLSDVPGVPSGFASCVAYRESTDDTNPAANGNAYGIIPASGHDVAGDSLAQQKAVFKQIYDTSGPGAWAADGCPGT
jgi:LysM repeat protein